MNYKDHPKWVFSVRYRGHNLLPLFAVILFSTGALAGWLVQENRMLEMLRDSRGSAVRLPGYSLINPLLECEIVKERDLFDELTPFKDKVSTLLKDRTENYRLSHVSVYFRDMNNGLWFGINEKEEFSPASLLKVPNMIACLKQAESDPSFLKRRVVYSGAEDLNASQHFKPLDPIRPGRTYTIDDLLFHAVVGSDNNANSLLFSHLDQKLLFHTYRDLGIEVPQENTRDDFLSVKAYSSFFRILFNASYLSKGMSQRALNLLAQADFRDGIVAGVPPNVVVAQKFGERRLKGQPGVIQLHDCGIVYYPDHPYLLCIMSRGRDITLLDDIIRDVSHLVYNEVDRQHRNR